MFWLITPSFVYFFVILNVYAIFLEVTKHNPLRLGSAASNLDWRHPDRESSSTIYYEKYEYKCIIQLQFFTNEIHEWIYLIYKHEK